MFARNFVLIGAAAVLTTVAGTDAFARGGHRGHVRAHVCHKTVRTPDVWKTVKVKVRVKRAWCSRKIIPAVWGEKKEKVIVRREHYTRHRSRAVYKTVTETHMVRPARTYRYLLVPWMSIYPSRNGWFVGTVGEDHDVRLPSFLFYFAGLGFLY